jgi:uncharacterized protein YfdQ (DUF2303 family)
MGLVRSPETATAFINNKKDKTMTEKTSEGQSAELVIKSTPMDMQPSFEALQIEGGNDSLLIHKKYRVVSLASLKTIGGRVKGEQSFDDLRGFFDYVNKYKNEDTAIFINQERIKAVFDYHKASNDSNSATHTAIFKLKPNPTFFNWLNNSSKWFSQEQFVDFLDTGLEEVINPNQAVLLDLIKNLRASISYGVDIENNDGAVKMTYVKETKAAGRGGSNKVEQVIPDNFTLLTLPFKALDTIKGADGKSIITPKQLTVRLAYQVNSESEVAKVKFRYLLLLGNQFLEQTYEDIKSLVVTRCEGIATYIGG